MKLMYHGISGPVVLCPLRCALYHLVKIINLITEVSLRNQSAVWLVLSGMVIFVLGAVLGWYGFPALVRSQIISVSTNIPSHLTVTYVKPYFAYSTVYSGWLYLNLAKESQINAERECHLFQNLELKEGAERREIWEKVPYPIDFKIYLFNVTNPMEVQKGATPVIQEVGPYCYK